MKALLLAATVLLTGIAVAPTAEADTCIFFEDSLEPLVCGPYFLAWCIVSGGAKELPKNLALCDGTLA